MRQGLALVVLLWAAGVLCSSASADDQPTPQSPPSDQLIEVPRLARLASAPAAARLRLSDRTAEPGTLVRLRGRGFKPRSRAVVSFAGRRLRVARTRARGGLRTAIRIPYRIPGVYAVSARTGGRPARVRLRIPTPRPRRAAPISLEVPPQAPASRSPVDDGASERPGSGPEGTEFPDPTVIRVGSTYYAYGTGGSFHQIMRSTDLVNWDWLGTAMRGKPEWVVAAEDWHAWAPSVLPTQEACPGASEPGCFILYYVGLSDRYGTAMTNCVGVATSSRPEGPFTDRGPLEREDGLREGRWPVGCGDAAGYGNIDPQPFVDADGRTWLYVSTDWRCTDTCRLLPEISAIPLSTDRLRAAGARQPLLAGQKDTWEQAPWAPVIENPYVVKRGDTYHLLYSGGNWQDRYAMGHATAPTATGPFTRSSTNPWTGGTDSVLSMGGGMPFRDGAGDEWLVYHGRDESLAQPRTLRIDRLSWTDERPRLDGPSTGARAAPTP